MDFSKRHSLHIVLSNDLLRIFHLVPDEPVVADLSAARQRVFPVQVKMHQLCGKIVDIAHDREHIQITFSSCKGVERTYVNYSFTLINKCFWLTKPSMKE